jgi:hypothetical protein
MVVGKLVVRQGICESGFFLKPGAPQDSCPMAQSGHGCTQERRLPRCRVFQEAPEIPTIALAEDIRSVSRPRWRDPENVMEAGSSTCLEGTRSITRVMLVAAYPRGFWWSLQEVASK